MGPPNMLAYAASKFAVIGMTQTAAKDLAPYRIRVNALSPALIGPGLMWTRQTELQAAVGSQYFAADADLRRAILFIAITLLTLTVSALAEEWPGWRGPRGDGTSLEATVPTRWSEKENIVWKVPIPGKGHSSPIVWGERSFVTTCLEEKMDH